MSFLDGLRKGRGRPLLASGAVPRRGLKPLSTDHLPADRLAAALSMLPVASSWPGPSQLAGWVPQRDSGVRSALHTRLRERALSGPAPVVSAPVVSAPAVLDIGRHRGTDEQLVDWVQQLTPAVRPPSPVRAPEGARGGTVPVGSAQAISVPVVSVRVVLEGGRHRRPAPPKRAILTVPAALRWARAGSRRLVVMGVLVLMVVVVVFGVRVALARSSSQPQPVAAAAHGQLGGLVARTVPVTFGELNR